MSTSQVADSPSSHRRYATACEDIIVAMCNRDVQRLRALIAPEVQFHIPPSATMLRPPKEVVGDPPAPGGARDLVVDGRDGWLASYTDGSKRFFDKIEAPEFIHVAADGDVVVPVVRIRAVMPNGELYDNVYCYPMRFEDGKLIEMWEIHDTMYAFPIFVEQLNGTG